MGACIRQALPEPKTSQSGQHLPSVVAAIAETPAKHHLAGSIMKASASAPSLNVAHQARERSDWPCAATFEKPPVGCQSKDLKGLSVHHCLTPYSRDIGEHSHLSLSGGKSRKSRAKGCANAPNDNDAEGVLYINPFMTRFFDRRQNGGFFAGSALAAPKITHHALRP